MSSRAQNHELNLLVGAIAEARMAPVALVLDRSKPTPEIIDIQYMPPGRQTVAPFVKGEPTEMEIVVTAKYAEVFQQALLANQAAVAAGQASEAFTDFDHADGAASSRPRRYYWGGDDPKTGGVRLETALTGSGKDAIEKGDYTRFSPRWIFHKKTMEPLGLPVNQGGFVNRAAFQALAPLKDAIVLCAADSGRRWFAGVAAAAAADDGDDELPGDCDGASALAFKKSSKAAHGDDGAEGFDLHSDAAKAHEHAAKLLKAAGRHDEAETHKHLAAHHNAQAVQFGKQALADPESVSEAKLAEIKATINTGQNMNEQELATAVAKAVDSAIKPLSDKIVALETKATEAATAQAKAAEQAAVSAVQRHVDRGAIAPQDTETIGFWKNAYLASASAAEAQMSRLPGKKFVRMTAGTGTAGAGALPHDGIIAAAKDLRAKNTGLASDAQAIEAYMATPAGKRDYEAYRDSIISGQSGLPTALIRK